MGIYIEGMKMPNNCCECRLLSGFECRALLKDITEFPVADECPLVPVPQHGRLIDADALIKVLKTKAKHPLNIETAPYSWAFAYECLADVVGDMPTIIPAEEGEA